MIPGKRLIPLLHLLLFAGFLGPSVAPSRAAQALAQEGSRRGTTRAPEVVLLARIGQLAIPLLTTITYVEKFYGELIERQWYWTRAHKHIERSLAGARLTPIAREAAVNYKKAFSRFRRSMERARKDLDRAEEVLGDVWLGSTDAIWVFSEDLFTTLLRPVARDILQITGRPGYPARPRRATYDMDTMVHLGDAISTAILGMKNARKAQNHLAQAYAQQRLMDTAADDFETAAFQFPAP